MKSAVVALVINVFVPLIHHSLPYLVAVVSMRLMSLPLTLGSVKHAALIWSPLQRGGRYLSFCSFVPSTAMNSLPKLPLETATPRDESARHISSMAKHVSSSPYPCPPYSCGKDILVNPSFAAC